VVCSTAILRDSHLVLAWNHIQILIDKILRIKQDNKTDDESELEAEIDDRVAHLYRLTAEEMKIIRG
jgi:hypothetical protein